MTVCAQYDWTRSINCWKYHGSTGLLSVVYFCDAVSIFAPGGVPVRLPLLDLGTTCEQGKNRGGRASLLMGSPIYVNQV